MKNDRDNMKQKLVNKFIGFQITPWSFWTVSEIGYNNIYLKYKNKLITLPAIKNGS